MFLFTGVATSIRQNFGWDTLFTSQRNTSEIRLFTALTGWGDGVLGGLVTHGGAAAAACRGL